MKTNRTNRFLGRFLGASAIVMSFFGLAQAATYYWDGATTVANGQTNNATTTAQNWVSGGNWDSGLAASGGTSAVRLASVFTASDDVVIGGTAASQTINLPASPAIITIRNMTFGGGTAGATATGAVYTIAGGTLALSSSTITNNTGITISSALTGTTGLTKAGNAYLTLSGDHSGLSGTTTINAWGLNMNATSVSGISTNTTPIVVNNGGQFYGAWQQQGITYTNNFTISGNGFTEGTFVGVSAIRASNNQIFSGPITLAAASRIGMIETSAASTFSGKITGAFALNIQGAFNGNSGTQTITLANAGAASDYTGDLSITAVDYGGAKTGAKTILSLGADNQIPNSAGKGNLILSGANADHQTIFELNGKNETINGISNAAAAGAIIRNTASGASILTIGDADAAGSFSGVISDGGVGKTLAITKIGTAALTLGGVNTYTGPTSINAGTLVINTAGAAATTDIVVKNAATLQLNATGKALQRLGLEDGAKLTLPVTAAQTTTITNDLDFSSAPTNFTVKPVFTGTVLAGTYDLLTPGSISNSGNLGTITLDTSGLVGRAAATASTFMSGGKLVLTVGNGPASLVWDNVGGAGTSKWSVETLLDNNFKNGASNDMFFNADSVTFGNAAAGTVSLIGTLSPAAVTVNSTGNYTFTGSGSLAGTTGLVKSGSGALTIETANTFTGPTSLNLGTLTAAATGALGASPVTIDAGTLNLNAAGAANPGIVTLNGGSLVIGDAAAFTAAPSVIFGSGSTGTVRLNGNNLTLAGLNTTGFSYTPVVENGAAGTATLTVNNAAANSYYGVLSNGSTGTLALVKSGTGALTLGGTNSYTGTTTVLGGILNLNAAAPTVLGGFFMSGPDQTYTRPQQPYQFGPGVVANFTSATNAWNRFEFFGRDQAFAGIATGNLTTQGGGVLQNSETNGAAGANATLLLNGDSSAPSYPVGGYVYNGHLRDYGATAAGTFKLNLVKSGTGTQTLVGGVVSHSGATTVNAGALTLQDTTVFASPITVGADGTLNVVRTTPAFAGRSRIAASAITGNGIINANSPGSGLAGGWVITSGLNFSGIINVNSGVFGTDNNGVVAGSAVVNVAAGAVLTNHSSTSFTLGALNGAGDVTPAQAGNGTYNLTLGANNLSGSYAGIIHGNNTTSATDGTMECGFLSLTKIGTGTQILSGVNTYTGATTIRDGVLVLSGGSNRLAAAGLVTLGDTTTSGKLVLGDATLPSDQTLAGLSSAGLGGSVVGGNATTASVLTLNIASGTSTYAGGLGGGGSNENMLALTKAGAGTLTLSGASTYTGTTTVGAGTLVLSGTGASPIQLNAGTLLLTGSTTGTLTTATGTTLSGEGTAGAATLGVDAILVADPATAGALKVGGLTLSGKVSVSLANGAFSPGVPFTVLQFDSNESGFLDSDFQLANGSSYRAPTFLVDEVSTQNKVTLAMGSLDLTWNNGAATGTWDNSAFNFRSGAADSDFKWGDFVTFNDAANPAGPTPQGAQAINISGTQQPAGVTIAGSANNYTFSGSGKISGSTGLVKSGTSTARFSQLNDYSGGTLITGGTLEANAAGALGTGTITVNGGTLNAMFAGSLGSAPVTLTSGTFNVTTTGGLGTGIVTVNGGTMNASAANALNGGTVNLAGGTLVVNNATTPFGSATVAAKGGLIQYATGITADISATLKNGTSPILIDTNGNAVTWATALPNTNTGGLSKLGTGTLTISGSSTYTGDTVIQGGVISAATLAVAGTASSIGAGNTGATALTFDGGTLRYTGAAMVGTTFNRKIRLNAGGGTFDMASTGIGWIAGAGTTSVITGPGSFTKMGTQQLIISGFSDYDGITYVNAGDLQIRDSARGLGSTVGKTIVASGAQLATGGGGAGVGTIFENIDLNGTGVSGSGALQCNDGPAVTFAGTITLVTDSAIGGNSPNWMISGPVVGTGGLTKVGTQMATLSGTNTYTGTTTVSAGTLALTGTNVSPITLTAGILQLSGSTTGAITAAAATTVAGEGTAPSLSTAGAATLNIDPTTSGAFTTSGALTLGGTLSVALVGPVTGTGAIKVINFGSTTATAASFALANSASIRGGTTATFTVNANDVTLSGLSKKAIEWTGATNSTWDIAGTANFRDTTTLASEKFYTSDDVLFGNLPGASPTVTISGTVLPSSITINSTAAYSFTGGSIGGTTSILKSGIGSVTLGQANSFTGGITISQGAVTLGTAATAGGTGTITLGDAGTGSNTVSLTTNLAATFANPITVTNNGTGLVTITQTLASTLSGTVTLNRPTVINSNAAAAIFGRITGTVGTLTIGGSNTTSLSNTVASDFTGNIEIVGGTTQATAMANALPSSASLTIRSGVFQLTNGFSQALDALNGGVAGATGVQNANAAAATLTLGSANGSGTFIGNIVAGTGALSIVKTGTGIQVLNGILTYTGTTAVSQGTLQLPAESTLTGAVTVADGATLAVGGRTGYSLITNSLTLGTSGATTLAINNLSPAPVGTPLRVNTTLATNGPVTLNVDVSRISAPGTYPLIAYPASGIGGSGFGAFTLGSLPSGFAATLNNNTVAKTIELVVTSVGSLLWAGNNGPAWDVNTTENWLMGATASKFFNGDKAGFDDSAASFAPTLATVVNPASVTFTNATNDYTLSGAGGIGGSGTITKTGTAKLTLRNANPTTGLTSVTGGTLQLGDATANGSVGGNIHNTANLVFANASAQTYAGAISGSPFGLLTKTGAGTLALTGANTCGDIAVSQGTLQIGDGAVTNLGSIPATSLVSVASGATMAWNIYSSATVGSNLSGVGNLMFQGQNAAGLVVSSYAVTGNNTGFTGTLSANRARVIVTAAAATQLGGAAIDLQYGGQLYTQNAATIANNITVGNGAGWHDAVSGDSVLGALRLDASPTLTGNITLNNTASIIDGDTSGTNSVLCTYAASNAIVSGVISGPGDLAMCRWSGNGGVGTISLTGTSSNTYTGKTVVDGVATVGGVFTYNRSSLHLMKTGGAVAIPSGTVVQMGSATTGMANLRMGDIVATGASRNQWNEQFGSGVVMNFVNTIPNHMRFDLQGTTQTLAGVQAGSSTVQAGAVIQNVGNALFNPGQDATLTLNGSGSYLFHGWLRDVDNGTVTRKLNLVKSGTGTQTFVGNQITHTGTNTIDAGTLVFPARGAAYGDTSITTSGAKLGITGTSGTVFTVPYLDLASGAKLSVGNFANLTGTNKCIDVTSALTVDGPVTVDIPSLPAGAGPFPVIKYPTGTYAGNDFVLDTSAWTLPRWLSSPALVNDTGTSSINLTAAFTPLVWAGTASANWDLTTQNWTINAIAADYDEGDAVQFDESGTATNPNVVLNTAVTPYVVNFLNTTTAYSLSGTGGIGGSAAIFKSGTGTVVIKNANPTTGLTTITQGILQLGDGTLNGSVGGNIAMAGALATDATLVLNPVNQTLAGIISGSATSGTVSKIGTGTAILTGASTFAGATNITGGTLQLGDGTIQPTLNSTYAIGSSGTLKLQYSAAGYTIWDAATFQKFTGAGTLVLATGKTTDNGLSSVNPALTDFSSSFTGTLQIDGGRVALKDSAAGLGGITSIVVKPGGQLAAWRGGTISQALSIAGFGFGEVVYEVSIRMANAGLTTTLSGPVSLASSTAVGSQSTGVGIISGVISGGAGADLTIGAASAGSATGWQDGTVALAAANTFVGKVTVNMGTLRLDHALALQNNTLNLNGLTGSTGNPLGQATFNSSVVGNAFTLGGLEGYRPLALQNTATTPAAIALSVGFNNTNTTYTGALSGAGSLVKIGTGTLTLSGPGATPTSNSSFSGNITVTSGKLTGAALRTGSNTVFGLASNTRTITVNTGATLEFQAPNTFGNHNATTAPTLMISGGTVTNIAPATNNALNNVNLVGGTLTSTVGSASVLDRGYETYGAWGINGAVTSSGLSTITTTAGSDGQVLLNSSGTSTTFTVTDGTLTVSTVLIDGERGTVPAGYATTLIKNGGGTMILTKTNTYTGPTSVTAGTLQVDTTGSLHASSAVTISGTGTLKGTGTVNGTLTVQAGGTVAPGASVGTLTTGAASIAGTYACEVSGATCDKLVANGNIDLTGAVLTVTGTASFSGPVVLIDYSSGAYTRTGTFTSVTPGFTVTYDDTNKKVLLASGGGYDAWASQIADVNKRGKGDDADGDGFTNLQEFLFGKDPEVADGSLTTTERTANGLVIRWRERTANASYKLLESATLVTPWTQWNPTPPTYIMENDGAQDGDASYGFYQPKKATVPLTPDKNFFRVQGEESN